MTGIQVHYFAIGTGNWFLSMAVSFLYPDACTIMARAGCGRARQKWNHPGITQDDADFKPHRNRNESEKML